MKLDLLQFFMKMYFEKQPLKVNRVSLQFFTGNNKLSYINCLKTYQYVAYIR